MSLPLGVCCSCCTLIQIVIWVQLGFFFVFRCSVAMACSLYIYTCVTVICWNVLLHRLKKRKTGRMLNRCSPWRKCQVIILNGVALNLACQRLPELGVRDCRSSGSEIAGARGQRWSEQWPFHWDAMFVVCKVCEVTVTCVRVCYTVSCLRVTHTFCNGIYTYIYIYI